jgi:N4-gp56 family major capsid protein
MSTLVSSTFASDQEKFLASKLLSRSYLRLVCASVCDKIQQPNGAGLTANFVRYQRMNVPVTTISEGVDPAESSFSLGTVTVTLDQWGDVLTLSDVAQLTTKHPLLQQAIELLAENAARVMDREIQLVWLAGTNVQYGDGSVVSRATITSSMKMSDSVIHKARINLVDGGAPPRGGPSGSMVVEGGTAKASSINGGAQYVAICGPQVMGDIMQASTSLGSWASVAMYANTKALYASEVGSWLNIRWVETNFIPKFNILGNTTAAVASTGSGGITGLVVTAVDGGGSLTSSTTFFWKVTRKNLLRGFEEDISIAHSTASTATGNNESFTFAFPSTAGYVYNLYFDTVAGGGTGTDATLGLVSSNIAASATVTVTANPAATTNPPGNVNSTGTPTIHPVYIHGAESCNWVALQNLQTFLTKDMSTTDNPLQLRRKVGYKFLAKAMIRDQSRMIRCEVAASY